MRVVIPLSGEGVRFKEAGYEKIKPLILAGGRPIMDRLLDSFPQEWKKTFICNEEQAQNPELLKLLKEKDPGHELVAIPKHKKGPVFAVLEGMRVSPEAFSMTEPTIVNYCDFAFQWDPLKFQKFAEETDCDGAIVCYTGFHPEYIRPTLYAYCREENGRVLEIREKHHFTPDRTQEHASSGTYYFKSGAIIKKYFEKIMEEGPLLKGEGYVSVVYNPLIQDGLDVRIFEIPYFLQFGTPSDLKDFEYWHKIYSYKWAKTQMRKMQVLMPMAGRGARFEGEIPKPLHQVLGKPMFVAALEHLPQGEKNILVVRDEFKDAVAKASPHSELVSIQGVTEGQAITCELAAKALDPKLPVFVSSCDHGMIWDEEKWGKTLGEDPDLVVWGQRDYPGADVTPKAFAYIQKAEKTDDIVRVSVKEPLGENPREDLLLVGTFYFKSPALMMDLISELKSKNIRVNGEFYLDSVVNLAVERGLRVKAFESLGYLCWGTPLSLQEFNYWHSYFNQLKPSR